MDQLVQIGRYSSPHGIHHHVHFLLHHLHFLGHEYRTNFYLRGMASILRTVPSVRDIALFLDFSLLFAPIGQVTTILLIDIQLVVWAILVSLVPLV